MPNGLVKGAFCNVAARDMRQRDFSNQGRLCSGQHLKTIAQYYQEIRLQSVKRIGKTDDTQPH